MDKKEALRIVLDLAYENVLDERDIIGVIELVEVLKEQDEALVVIQEMLDELEEE